MTQLKIHSWIKTPCGRTKYAELDARAGLLSRIRLGWFIFFAAIKDWHVPNPDQSEDSES